MLVDESYYPSIEQKQREVISASVDEIEALTAKNTKYSRALMKILRVSGQFTPSKLRWQQVRETVAKALK